MLVSSIPSKDSITIFRIEDSEVRSDKMKELGGTFMLEAQIIFSYDLLLLTFPPARLQS